MKAFLLRHGTRDFVIGDVPLNDEGQDEALNLTQDPNLLTVKKILCSPKKRALMTVQPLANQLKLDIEIHQDLDQMQNGESETEFLARVKMITEVIPKQQQNTLICSHSDWLSAATHIIPTDSLDLKFHRFVCAEYLSFKIENDLWKHIN